MAQVSVLAKLDIDCLPFTGSAELNVRSLHVKGSVDLSFSPGLETVTVSFKGKPQVGYSAVAKLNSKNAVKAEVWKGLGGVAGYLRFGVELLKGKGDQFVQSSPLLVSCDPWQPPS